MRSYDENAWAFVRNQMGPIGLDFSKEDLGDSPESPSHGVIDDRMFPFVGQNALVFCFLHYQTQIDKLRQICILYPN